MALYVIDKDGNKIKVAGAGAPGKDGTGIPAGGTAGQVLAKKTDADQDVQWKTLTAADVGALPVTGGTLTGDLIINPSAASARAGGVTVDPLPKIVLGAGDSIQLTTLSEIESLVIKAPDVRFELSGDSFDISDLKTSVSEGKALIASAVTDKGVDTSADASFQTMHDNILAIPAGGLPGDVRTISLTADPADYGTVSGGGVASDGMTVTVNAATETGYQFTEWKENGSTVSKLKDYTFEVSQDRNLTAEFIKAYVAGVDWWTTVLPALSTSPGMQCYGYICYGDGKFVTVPQEGSNKSAYSTNGISWFSGTLPRSGTWFGIAYGNGKFVTLCYSTNNFAYSTDGIKWTSGTLPSSAGWQCVAYGGGKFVAIARGSNKAAYSTNGTSWSSSTLPSSSDWYTVTYGGGKFVAIALNSNKAAYSTDGVNWTAVTLPESLSWRSVTYGDGKFVAVSGAKAAYSENGITWTVISLPDIESGYQDVVYGDGMFVAVGFYYASYSTDGIVWNRANIEWDYWYHVAYGDGRFVATTFARPTNPIGAYSSALGPNK